MRRLAGLLLAVIVLTGCGIAGSHTGTPSEAMSAMTATQHTTQDQAGQAARLADEAKQQGTPVQDGNRLTFTYQGHPGDRVDVSGGVNLALKELGQTGLFVGDVQVPDLDKAIISYTLSVNDKATLDPWSKLPTMTPTSPVVIFRGAKAAHPTEIEAKAAVPHGEVAARTVSSKALGEDRRVWVYLPPGFTQAGSYPVILAADGQMYFEGTIHLATILDNLIAEKKIPPVAVIAAESHLNTRVQDFIFQQPNFDAYQTFVRNELLPWAAQEYHLNPADGGLVPLGLSNGGAWALYTSMFTPEEIRGAILQSALTTESTLPKLPSGNRYYISAGTLDPSACALQDELAKLLQSGGNDVKTARDVGGHDGALWETQLVDAMTWMFAK